MLNDYLSSFLTQYVADKEVLPDIEFHNNSIFHPIHQYISDRIHLDIDSDSTEEMIISETMGQIDDILRDTENADYVATLDKAANNLSMEVSKAFNTLRYEVAEEVDVLRRLIAEKVNEYLRKENASILINGETANIADFTVIKWDNLRSMNYVQHIFDLVKTKFGIDVSDITRGNVKYVRNKLIQSEHKTVSLNSEIRQSIVDSIDRVVTTRNTDEIDDALDIILNSTRYTTYCKNLYNRMAVENDIADDLAWILDRADLIHSTIKAFDNIVINISDESKASILQNLKCVEITTTLSEYFILFCKNVQYKGKLIINKNMINNQELNEFSKSGGKIEDISRYIRAYYHDTDIPVTGISTTLVTSTKDKVNELVTSSDAKIKSKARVLLAKSTANAYMHVLNQYLLNMEDSRIPEGMSSEEFYQMKYRIINRTVDNINSSDENVEDALYRFLLETFYKDSIVQKLYVYMGKEYPKILTQYDNINEDTVLKIVDNYVVAALVAEYLVVAHCK
jgi:hypothetical protein